ncbi:MAG: hypothetical protein SGJ18_02960 [Pseudomonadota bacterium]|nr:hypothetical protein [Pseudomonadota bacterium]
MKFENLIGQVFFENEFYELLLFDIEENFEQYFSKFIHFYFDRVEGKKIIITELAYFKDSKEMNKESRKIIEKKEWFEVCQNHNHFNLLLCRFDRTGFVSSVEKDSTLTQEWRRGWADEEPDLGPMTPDEIRQAVRELSGFFCDQQELQKLRSKKAV